MVAGSGIAAVLGLAMGVAGWATVVEAEMGLRIAAVVGWAIRVVGSAMGAAGWATVVKAVVDSGIAAVVGWAMGAADLGTAGEAVVGGLAMGAAAGQAKVAVG